MKRWVRILALAILAIVVLAGAGIGYFLIRYPDADPVRALTVARTPERIERGRYLANHVTGCIDCHSERNLKYFAAPVVGGTEGKGGQRFDENIMDLPGVLYARNITPAGIGTMTDGQLFRVLTAGIDRDGNVLFPLMGYPSFNKLTDEDLYSIIAYIRTLPPIENAVPKSHINFPVNLLIRTVPAHHVSQPEPNRSNPYEYGKYLVNAAGCGDCHTPMKKGEPVKGMEFAGGAEFRFPVGTIRSANITPDEETGIGAWTKEFFVARFKEYDKPDAKTIDPETMHAYTVMPWTLFAGMTEDDLGAIYTYLRTLPPVHHQVEHFSASARP